MKCSLTQAIHNVKAVLGYYVVLGVLILNSIKLITILAYFFLFLKQNLLLHGKENISNITLCVNELEFSI